VEKLQILQSTQQEQDWEIEGLNDEDIAIEMLDERVEFATMVADCWDNDCPGFSCDMWGV
jgi:hypothetical protein